MNRILLPALILIVISITLAFILRDKPLKAEIREDQLIVGDQTRTFRIVVPHTALQPTPVVFAFHGIGDSADSMAKYSQLDRIAEQNGFILVYPTALNSMWATINVDLTNLDLNPDVQFFDSLLEHLAAVAKVDRDRIYVVGMSNGATFAQLLATARSNEIAAIVAHSGPRLQGLAKCERTLPIMLIAGANDSESSTMKSDADQYRRHGHVVEYISVPQLAHAWSARHNQLMWRFLSRHRIDTGWKPMPH